jgi:hypothetical protein
VNVFLQPFGMSHFMLLAKDVMDMKVANSLSLVQQVFRHIASANTSSAHVHIALICQMLRGVYYLNPIVPRIQAIAQYFFVLTD